MNATDYFIIGMIIGGMILYYLLKKKKSLAIKRMLRKARKGEHKAIHLLESNGYTVTGAQERKTITTWINGKPYENHVRADYLVKKRGKTFVAEVKTGKNAPKPTLADTRRQLMEYYLAYGTDGILLIDMERRKINEVVFAVSGREGKTRFVFLVVFTGILGLLCGLLLYKYFLSSF